MKTVMIGGAVLALLALPATAASANPAKAGSSTAAAGSIAVPLSAGSGCADQSAAISIAPDGSGFSATYSSYRVSTAPVSATRRNCQFLVTARPPAGYVYSTVQVDNTGTARLAAAVTAGQTTTVNYQGAAPQAVFTGTIAGPLSAGWQTTGTADLTTLGSPACGAETTLMLNTSLNLPLRSGADPATNSITTDSTKASFTLLACA